MLLQLNNHFLFPDTFKEFARVVLLSHRRICWHYITVKNGEPGFEQSGIYGSHELPIVRNHKSVHSLPNLLNPLSCFQTHDSRAEGERCSLKDIEPINWASLPSDLLIHVLSFIAPEMRQCISRPSEGRVNIHPAMLPSDPATWSPSP